MSAGVREAWRTSDCVCFDVDSTVIAEEGIDVLAAHCGCGESVAEWTKRAMGGSVLFEVALQARLDLIRPSRAQVDQIAVEGQLHLTPRIDELVARLLELGKRVCLVSGGFRQMIAPVAARLGINSNCVFANQLLFDDDGAYAGFDATEFTSRSGGKGRAIEHIKKQFGCVRVIMIGDGATDLEARPPADNFIGFGGIVEREAVRLGADWFVRSFDDLIHELSEARSTEYTAAAADAPKLGMDSTLHGVGSSHSCSAVDLSRLDLECANAGPAEQSGGGTSA